MRRKKPGPKATLKNPRPVDVSVSEDGRDVVLGTTSEISAADLDAAERRLRAYFKTHRAELRRRPGEPLTEAVTIAARRIMRLVIDALTAIHAERWSGYGIVEVVNDAASVNRVPPRWMLWWGRGGARRHVGADAPARAEDKCLWLDTSGTPAVLKTYDRRAESWREVMKVEGELATDPVERERLLDDIGGPSFQTEVKWDDGLKRALRGPIERMLYADMGRAGKSGRPAYLAYATLGTLLDRTPEAIADLLNNFRHPRRRPGLGTHR